MTEITIKDRFEIGVPPRADVSIIVGTFGDYRWANRGRDAVRKVERTEFVRDSILAHGKTLAQARNDGAGVARTEWLIFLDADDELAPGYVDAMLAGEGDIRKPATLGVYPDGSEDDEPVVIPERDLEVANHIVIGAMCRRDLFLKVGGFAELPALEDWHLWRRMVKAGATIGTVPEAVYRVGVNPNSRNQNTKAHNETYWKIRRGLV